MKGGGTESDQLSVPLGRRWDADHLDHPEGDRSQLARGPFPDNDKGGRKKRKGGGKVLW